MRRLLISTATAATLLLGSVGGAAAASAQSVEAQSGDVADTVSSAVTDPEGSSDRAQEELPEYLTLGSSGVEQMSASDFSSQSWLQGSSQIIIDWAIGAVLITVLGQVIQIVSSTFF